MPSYSYKAKRGPTEVVTGSVDAATREDALSKILQSGLSPISISIQNDSMIVSSAPARERKALSLSRKVPLQQIALFVRSSSDLFEAGVPLLRSLELLTNQTKNPYFKSVISDMRTRVREGASLSKAMNAHGDIFSPLYINMVKSGELSGHLAEMLLRLADLSDNQIRVRSEVRAGMMYPLIVFAVGFLTMIVLFTFVLPRLIVIFEDFDATLPMITVVIIAVSHWMSKFWWLVLAVIGGTAVYVQQWVKSESGRKLFDRWIMKVPLMGRFVRQIELGRFTRTLAILLDGGVSIVPALQSLKSVVENHVFREHLNGMIEQIAHGGRFSQALAKAEFADEMTISMVAVGEESGNLQKGLYKLADACDRQCQDMTKLFINILGPVMLVIIVMIVGVVILSLLMPILKMNLIVN